MVSAGLPGAEPEATRGLVMGLFQAIRNVAANLLEGAEPTAVRTAQNAVPSPAFVARREAVEQTEQFIASLAGDVPAELMPVLLQCVAHVEQPLRTLPALAERVASQRQAFSAAIDRAGLVLTPQQAQQQAQELAQLAELERVLAPLWAPRPENGLEPGLVQRTAQRPDEPAGPPDER